MCFLDNKGQKDKLKRESALYSTKVWQSFGCNNNPHETDGNQTVLLNLRRAVDYISDFNFPSESINM